MANKGRVDKFEDVQLTVEDLVVVNTATVAGTAVSTGITGGGAAITSLTDNSGGTANNTLQVISATPTQAEIANNDADLAAKVNEILAALRTAGIIAT